MNKGFTFFELLLVMVLGAAITALGVVSLYRLQTIFGVRSSADEMRSQFQYGRELSIANKNRAIYSISLSQRILRLLADGKEIERFQIPAGIGVSPTSFVWTFTPVTGVIPMCSPCQITLTSGSSIELINISANGIIN